jgi:hydroxypyruvate isomerase
VTSTCSCSLISVILDNLAAGETTERILAGDPSLEEEDIEAALRYADELASDRNETIAVVQEAPDAVNAGQTQPVEEFLRDFQERHIIPRET